MRVRAKRDGDAWGLSKIATALLCLPVSALAQFSPGTLSKAHHALEGPTRCTNCHVGGTRERKFRCLSCHQEIRQRITENRGMHPTLLQKGWTEAQCAKCHSDHNGEEFVPIHWEVDLSEFDHRKAGYVLDGGHARLQCAQCHNPERIAPAERRTILIKDARKTYLGLNRACGSCHKDEHLGQLGAQCERCHITGTWKNVTRFDHATAKFALTGAHERVACAKCHATIPAAGGGKPVVKFVGLAFQQCASCHQDPHKGAFPAGCNGCHNETVWKPARNLQTAFDHSKTKFPLTGKHALVTCDKCHKTADFKAPVAHELCGDCHRDVHGGQFATSKAGADCARCHAVEGWKPSTFTTESHGKSAYPLTGRHAAVTCAKCHAPAGAATKYRMAFQRCTDCHRDPHEAQFARQRCEDCHTVDDFRPARFTLAAHQKSRFPLTGAHAAVACNDCHLKRAEHPTTVAYRFDDIRCEGCHQDPHGGQFRERAGATCTGCHTVENWRDVSKFDHTATRFALTGAHRGAACDGCHKATALSANLRRVVFREAPQACAGCHEDIHAGQFKAAGRQPECETCHNNSNWKAAGFDHSKTAFSLIGAHAQVPCRDCHKNRQEVNGRMVVIYKPTPRDCAGCHATTVHN